MEKTILIMGWIVCCVIAAGIAKSKGRDPLEVCGMFAAALVTGSIGGLVWALAMKNRPLWVCGACETRNYSTAVECHHCLLTPEEVADTQRTPMQTEGRGK